MFKHFERTRCSDSVYPRGAVSQYETEFLFLGKYYKTVGNLKVFKRSANQLCDLNRVL